MRKFWGLASERWLEFIIDFNTNTLSASKLWYNIGNLALTIAFLHDTFLRELTESKIIAYGAVVCGSRIAHKVLSSKAKGKTK